VHALQASDDDSIVQHRVVEDFFRSKKAPAWVHAMTPDCVVKFVACCGIPPAVLDLPWFKDLMRTMLPDYNPPSATNYADSLLPKIAAATRQLQLARLQAVPCGLTYTMDGAKARVGSIYTATATSPLPDRFSVTLSGHHGNEAAHTADLIRGWMEADTALLDSDTSKSKGITKFTLIDTDNAANIRKARTDLVAAHPHLVHSLDPCHLLHNTMKDLAALSRRGITVL
jgi:hypothetical protein